MSPEVAPTWLSSAVSSWRVLACIQDLGLDLDADWLAAQRQAFVALAREACARLATRDSIPAEEIVGWRLLEGEHILPRGAKEVLTAPVAELGWAIIALLSGELPESPKRLAWFYGTPTCCSFEIRWENDRSAPKAPPCQSVV